MKTNGRKVLALFVCMVCLLSGCGNAQTQNEEDLQSKGSNIPSLNETTEQKKEEYVQPEMKGEITVSAFMGNPDGQFEHGAAAYEKRGTAVTVPTWDAEKCIQCNQCAFVCSHATIRPFMLSEDEVKAAPGNIKLADTKPKASEYKYTMSVSTLDCMGCLQTIL